MTANSDFKRLVRDRARRTGESYTAALRHLRRWKAEENPMQQSEWQRLEKPDFGYAVRIPREWAEKPPNLKNSPWETARFGDPSDRRRSVGVYRQPVKPGQSAVEVADRVQDTLESIGYTDFEIIDSALGGIPARLLRCARHDAGRVWALREYFIVRDAVFFCLACGSAIPEEDTALFDALAEGFELIS